nr:hypothetical protein [Tanacetum cinerariifolium]
MSRTILPPPGTNTGNTGSPNTNRVDTMPTTDTTNTTNTTNVAQNIVDENLPQLLDSRGGSHVINVPTFDKDDFTSCKVRFLVFLDGFEPYILKTLEDGPFVLMSTHEGPSDTRDTKIAALRLKFNAFKSLEGEKDEGNTKIKAFMEIAEDEPSVGKADTRSGYLISSTDLTTNMFELTLNTTPSKKSKKPYDKVSQAYVIKKKTETESPVVPKSCLDKKADSSTDQLLLTLMEEKSLMKRLMMDSSLATLQWPKLSGYSISEDKKWKKTIHVTFSEDDEAISQSSIDGDAINFNENRSFPNDEFLEPRSKVTQ